MPTNKKKVLVREGVQATVYNAATGTYETLVAGKSFDADDPLVAEHPWAFGSDVIEQATAAPGEKRSTSRRK